MAEQLVRDENIDGKVYKIYVDGDGDFFARDDPNEAPTTSDTIKGLIDKLRRKRRTAKVRVNLPATLLAEDGGWLRRNKDPKAEPVTVTGIHATHHKPLITHADGRKEAFDAHNEWLTRRLTEEEAAQWLALVAAKAAATKAVDDFKDAVKIRNIKDWITGSLIASGTTREAVTEMLDGVRADDQD